MLLVLNIIEIMILQNVEILHAFFLWTINGMEFSMAIFFFVSGGKHLEVLNFYFLLFSALLLLRLKMSALVVCL